MRIDFIKKYLTSTVKTPFFLFVGDEHYQVAIDELKLCELNIVPISKFCGDIDKIPDIDELLRYIEAADINADSKKFVVTGLGEFLLLQGHDEAIHTLSRLKDLNIGGAKVVLLLRGLSSLIAGLQTDPRFDSRRHDVIDDADCDLSLTVVAPDVNLSPISGLKAILTELEKGRFGDMIVNTAVNFDKAMVNVHRINNAYDGIKRFTKGFALACSCGSEVQWAKLLAELNDNNWSMDSVFEKYDLDENPANNFHARIAGDDYCNWLYFIYLKIKAHTLQNDYLRFAVDKTVRFEDFAGNVLNAIIEIHHTDKRFPSFYQDRKALIEKIPVQDIANFVVNNRKVAAESIYKLTDGTRVEREEIVAWLSKNGTVPRLDTIYPALADYLKRYVFKCPELADLLTDYFEAYKRQKLSNQLEPEFLKLVDELAVSRKYNRLPTRDEIIDSVDKDGTFLYWLDALGVEYLSLIESIAQKHGLSVKINITRAELPTITTKNRRFFDEWSGAKNGNDGDKALDEIKHKDSGGYFFTKNELPIHLAGELDVISAVINKAAAELHLRNCKRFLIASDHGASRLAVLCRKEEKYDTDTSGKHSGRCCKLFHPYELTFAAEENGYLVLADYGRFKGSRAANVEVHGGASLEEVVVPVIELSLKDWSVTVELVEETVIVDFKTGAEIMLFFDSPVQDVSVVLKGRRYQAVPIDENHFSVRLPDTKKAGNYLIDVYAGDDPIGKVMLKAQGKSGKVNDDFDDLF